MADDEDNKLGGAAGKAGRKGGMGRVNRPDGTVPGGGKIGDVGSGTGQPQDQQGGGGAPRPPSRPAGGPSGGKLRHEGGKGRPKRK